MAGKGGRGVADGFDFLDDGIFRAALDNAPFMLGDRAERAAAETAAHDVDRMLDHFKGGHVGVAVFLMRHAGIGQVETPSISLVVSGIGGGLIHTCPAVQLNQRARIAGIGFAVHDPRGMGVQYRVVFYGLIGGQADNGFPPFDP